MSIINKLLNLYWSSLYPWAMEKVHGKNANLSYKPYKSQEINFIYNLLFCDDLNLYKNNFKGEIVSPWKELFGEKDSEALEKIACDPITESRVRILAYNELRGLGIKKQKKELLGVIVEVGMDSGVDTLAAYVDKSARYINYTDNLIVWENANDANIDRKIVELFQVSEALILKIGPWDKKRLPPPQSGGARMTFLVSDGLYFGVGPLSSLYKDLAAEPVLTKASELVSLLVNKTLNK